MIAAVFGLALVMFVVGGAALRVGLTDPAGDLALVYVPAGAIVITGGCIVFALGCLAVAFGRSRSPAAAAPAPVPLPVPVPVPPMPAARVEESARAAPETVLREPAEAPVFVREPAAERRLAATYSAGGIGYFMYSDGSIEADMEIGRHRFPDMDALRRFIETGEGGVRVGPPDP
jgi:hypothetical protein